MEEFESLYASSKLDNAEVQKVASCFNSYADDIKKQMPSAIANEVNAHLISELPFQFNGCNNWRFSFGKCATDLIQLLFDRYVDDDTLVITSMQEHPKVCSILSKCKNVMHLIDDGKLYDMPLECFVKEVKRYRRVFVYAIGTSCGNGQHVPQNVFYTIKRMLQLSKVEHIFTIDAVQELFLLPRDYSMFDYVIGTAHAIVPQYDVGMVLSKHSLGHMQPLAASKFAHLLSIVKRRARYLKEFSHSLTKRYQRCQHQLNLMVGNHVGHLYSIGDRIGTLSPIIPDNQSDYHQMNPSRVVHNIYFRATWSLFSNVKFSSPNIDETDDEFQFFKMLHTTDTFLKELCSKR